MAITQKQVSDWFKLNPNATPEQVAQLVQSIGGLSANPGLANLIGNQYGMSGLNVGSVFENLTGQTNSYTPSLVDPAWKAEFDKAFKANDRKRLDELLAIQEAARLDITKSTSGMPTTSIEQMQSNTKSINALEDFAKKYQASEGEIIGYAEQQRIDPNLAKKFAKQYALANSSQVRDAFTNPSTKSADIVLRLQAEGISPETVARYTGITPQRASQIYTATLKDKSPGYTPDFGAVIPTGLMQATTVGGTTTADTAGTKQVVTDTKQVATVANTRENIDKLQSQILAQNTTAKWSGGLPTDKTALYMATDLDKSGITDISQVGKSDKGIINTVTGEKLFSGYGERTKGNLWSGSYEGSGNTGFGVQFTDSGKPIFYSEGASSSTLKKDLLKAAVVAAAAFGLVGPESLAGIFGSGAAVGEGLTAAEAFAAGLTPAQAVAAGLTTAELTAAGYTAAQVAAASTAATGLLTNAATAAATGLTVAQVADLAKAGLTTAQIAKLFSPSTTGSLSNLFSGGLTTAGSLLQQQTSKEAADKARVMIEAETAAAKQAGTFSPIGLTFRFGKSEYKKDPVTGQLISASSTLDPEFKAQQDRFVALSNQGLTQAEAGQKQFDPLQTGAQSLFNLGNQYISQTPQSVAENYLKQQMALLQPGRELELANLQNKLQQQGRGGLAVAQGGTLGDTTPELQALFNARAQQEALLAANAQKAGQADVLFGSGLLTQGAKTMGDYYAGQQAAYAPYKTAVGEVSALETLAQQPFTLSTSLAEKTAAAGARTGQLGLTGAQLSTNLATSANATANPYAQALMAAGNPNAMFGQSLNNVFSGLFGNTPQGSLTTGLTPAQIAAAEAGYPIDYSAYS